MNQKRTIEVSFPDYMPTDRQDAVIERAKRYIAKLQLVESLKDIPDSEIPYEEQMEIINAEVKAYRKEKRQG